MTDALIMAMIADPDSRNDWEKQIDEKNARMRDLDVIILQYKDQTDEERAITEQNGNAVMRKALTRIKMARIVAKMDASEVEALLMYMHSEHYDEIMVKLLSIRGSELGIDADHIEAKKYENCILL